MGKITNKELQAACDKSKYEMGFLNGCDNSGMMQWCDYCEEQRPNRSSCFAEHKTRVEKCLCAKAYRKMEKAIREEQ